MPNFCIDFFEVCISEVIVRSNKGNVNKNSDAMVTNTNTNIGDSICNLFRVNAIAIITNYL